MITNLYPIAKALCKYHNKTFQTIEVITGLLASSCGIYVGMSSHIQSQMAITSPLPWSLETTIRILYIVHERQPYIRILYMVHEREPYIYCT